MARLPAAREAGTRRLRPPLDLARQARPEHWRRQRMRWRGRPTTVKIRFVNELPEDAFQRLYGRWEPLTPPEVASVFEGAPFRWWIAGGWAAEASGAPRRPH